MKYKYFFLILIIIIAGFLRLYQVNQLPPGLYPDEAMNGNNALEALSNTDFSAKGGPALGWKVFYPENNGREGLFINIQAISVAFFGNVPWVLRLVSAIFGILTVLGVYFLAREIFKKQKSRIKEQKLNGDGDKKNLNSLFLIPYSEAVALLSSFLIATSFWHINFSRIGFRAIMAPFFLTWALYFLISALNKASDSSLRPYLLSSIFAGIAFGLGFHSYIAYRATPAIIFVVLVYFWFKNKDKTVRKKILLSTFYFVLAALIIVSPLAFYFFQHPQDFFGRTNQISIFSSQTPIKDLSLNILKTILMFNFKGDSNWRHNFADRPELFWPAGIIFIIGIVVGIRYLFKKIKMEQPAILQNPSGLNSSLHQTNDGQEIEQFNNFPTPDHPITAFDNFPIEQNPTIKQNQPQPNNNSITQSLNNLITRLPFLVLFSWFIAAALPIVISNEGLPHALRAIIMIPPVFILAGFGGIWLYENFLTKILRNTRVRNAFVVIFFALLTLEAYYTYFIKWGTNLNTLGAFAQNYVDMGRELKSLPKDLPKYAIVKAGGTDVRGIPMPTQTIMFITDTFTPEKQKLKNIFYILPQNENQIPQDAYKIILE